MSIQEFYAHGKLLLTSEYFVMDGAQSIALPTQRGQSMRIEFKTREHDSSRLFWKGYNSENQCWINCSFDLSTFQILDSEYQNSNDLRRILVYAHQTKPSSLQSDHDIYVTTHLEFPNDWGLGSSSTLISMIGQWLDIDPFDILDDVFGGSGYDIACASASNPIIYKKNKKNRDVHPIKIAKKLSKSLFFVHLNQKKDTKRAINHYKKLKIDKKPIIDQLNSITHTILECNKLQEFENLITEHEEILSQALAISTVKSKLFTDYWGAIKSLGAWGGDFILATSDKSDEETFAYFHERGYKTVLRYSDIIL